MQGTWVRTWVRAFSAAAIGMTLAAAAASAEGTASSGRVAKMRETGAITLGYPETSVPFAFLDGNQKPVGYSVEICEHVVQEIKAAITLPKLETRYTPTTSATRIQLLGNGAIDLECGNTTNKVERHELVAFAPTTFVAQVVLVARKDAGVDVNDPSSFRGKMIAAQAGGETFKVISQLNAKGNLGINVVAAKDTAETFLMIQTGRAAGTANDDGLAYAVVASSRTPDAFVIGTRSLELAPYGIMEPKDDPEFKALVDAAVVKLIKNGTVAALYQKYFNSPIPPNNLNLKYPMSEALKRALAHPTDSGDPAVYE
jgi:glutamate/aspartate transport system substrate-binding protein